MELVAAADKTSEQAAAESALQPTFMLPNTTIMPIEEEVRCRKSSPDDQLTN